MNLPSISLPFFLCGALSLALSVYAWRYRTTPSTTSFALLMLVIALYSGGYAMELASPDLETALFWSRVQYIGILAFPALYLIFVLQYVGKGKWLNPLRITLLFSPAIAFYLVKLFDHRLNWIYATAEMQMTNGLLLLSFTAGPLYSAIHVYQLLAVTWANILLLQKRRYSSELYRRQTGIMLIAALLVYAVFGLYLIGLPPIPILKGIDFNPLAFALWAAAIGWAIFRHRLLDLAPIAREVLIETLKDGVVVIDNQLRVVDANPEALQVFNWSRVPTGTAADQVMDSWFSAEDLHRLDVPVRLERSLFQGSQRRYYDVTISGLYEGRKSRIGYLILVHDITHQKRVEEELKELSLSDDLTGLSNRRGFKILADQMLGVANRMKMDAIVLYMDIDGLKKINDSLGHAAGDQALTDVANTLRRSFRATDVLARIGGDEFVVLALESKRNSAKRMLERLEGSLGDHRDARRNYELGFSTGVAYYKYKAPKAVDLLLEEADQAMYVVKQAKKDGQ